MKIFFITVVFTICQSTPALTISSSAFNNNTLLPAKYTCECGITICATIPPLEFKSIPPKTKSLLLIVYDPNAPSGIWIHWILYNLPANITQLSEQTKLPANVQTGKNSWGKNSYGMPCPPRASGTHHYHYQLFALDTILNKPLPPNYSIIMQQISGHVLEQAEIIGLYSRE